MSLLHGKQIRNSSLTLDKLSGTGSVILQTGAVFQVPSVNISASTDIVNKEYVDSVAIGLIPHASVKTNTNGGVTLSNPGTNIFNGYTASVGDRILIWQQTNPIQNGIYIFNGSASAFTRSDDMDGNPTSEVKVGDYTFATDGFDVGNGYVIIGGTSGVIRLVGTDSIVFSEFIGPDNLTFNNGLDANGRVIDIDLSATSGLTFSGGKLTVDSTIGGNGLGYSAGVLSVNTSNGITILSDSVQLNQTLAGSGLTFSSGVLSISSIVATGSGVVNYVPRWLSSSNLSGTSSITDDGNNVVISGLSIGKGLNSMPTNTVVGATALSSNLTASYSVAIGYNALLNNTIGGFNTAVGGLSLFYNTSGWDNTGVGYGSLLNNTSGARNTAVGYNALTTNGTGSINVALGHGSLNSNTSGNQNTGLGMNSLSSNTTGGLNIAVGVNSALSNTVGSNNTVVGTTAYLFNVAGSNGVAIGVESQRYINNTATPWTNSNTSLGYQSLMGSVVPSSNTGNSNNAIGYQTLVANTSGSANVAIGYRGLFSNTTGSSNIVIGHGVATLNTTGGENIAIGYNALYNNVAGFGSVAIGHNSMLYANNTSTTFSNGNTVIGYEAYRGSVTPASNIGNNNTAIGYQTLQVNSTGGTNSTLGYRTLFSNTSGSDNVAIGFRSMDVNTTGGSNVAVGSDSLGSNTTGVNNIAIGYNAGLGITTGSYNTIIGSSIASIGATLSNNIILADGQGNVRMQVDSLGNAVFGTVSSTAKVEIYDVSGNPLPLFRIQGSSGELFSVYDSLVGSLFSVNDISGLPILEAFSDNTILMGSYLAPSLNSTVKFAAVTGSNTIYSIPSTTYTGGFFEYTASDGANVRSGSIMSVWLGATATYTEVTTTDIGSTVGLTFSVAISGATASLIATTSKNWTIKTIIRSI